MPPAFPPRPASYDRKVGLVLQGGGALGSYQAGVYEILAGSDYQPDWIAGISIGAINAAIIAGNAPEHRVERLRTFWEEITSPTAGWPAAPEGPFASAQRQASALASMAFGQPGFFTPRPPFEWLNGPGPASWYDTAALKATLERLVDFDRINARETRLSLGAVNVRTGNFAYFDNARITLRPEHIMASGALPPGFPAIEIDGEQYWDGGLVSNTPLQYMMETAPRRSRIVFQVDLFSARGPLPATLDEAETRAKDIRYSSRTRAVTDSFRHLHNLGRNIQLLWDHLPEELRALPEAQFLHNAGHVARMDIVQLVYRPIEDQGTGRGYEFGRPTLRARWQAGAEDATATLAAAPWLTTPGRQTGVRSFDVGFARGRHG